MTRQAEPMPTGLSARGRRLWQSVTDDMELRADEVLLLEHAARTVDLLGRIDEELIGAPLTVKGSMGQLVEHPLVSESRAQRATLARLLGQLKLVDSDERAVVEQKRRTGRARKAASERWSPSA